MVMIVLSPNSPSRREQLHPQEALPLPHRNTPFQQETWIF
jgi:hypothetical protein